MGERGNLTVSARDTRFRSPLLMPWMNSLPTRVVFVASNPKICNSFSVTELTLRSPAECLIPSVDVFVWTANPSVLRTLRVGKWTSPEVPRISSRFTDCGWQGYTFSIINKIPSEPLLNLLNIHSKITHLSTPPMERPRKPSKSLE